MQTGRKEGRLNERQTQLVKTSSPSPLHKTLLVVSPIALLWPLGLDLSSSVGLKR